MSNSDASGDKRPEPQDSPATLPPMDDGPGASELREMLRKLGDQIAATDRQHSETLAEVQARLSQIGVNIEGAKPVRMPETPPAPADSAAVSRPPLSYDHASHPEHRPLKSYEADDENVGPASISSDPPQEPMFISSSSPQPWVLKSAAGRASGPHAAETFAAGDPWDRESADALTRIYETGEAMRGPSVDYRPGVSPRRLNEPSSASEASYSRMFGDADRSRLEDRFLQIALRIEQSMADMRSGAAFADLSPKFDQLEQRITAALDTLATRADVDGLRHVEAQVNELFTHVEHATAQLARLDGIELQLNALGDRLSDDRIGRLASELMPTEAELSGFAEVAADRAVAKLGAAAPEGTGFAGGMASPVEALLRSFIDERRANEEQTATILETLQQAMQYMLDRVHVIEQVAMHSQGTGDDAGPMGANVHDGSTAETQTSVMPAHAIERANTPADHTVMQSAAMDPPQGLPDHVPELDRASATAATSDMVPTRPDELLTDAPTHIGLRDGDESAPSGSSQPSMDEQSAAAPQSRDDFIAAARRAARKASGQPVRELPSTSAPTPPPVQQKAAVERILAVAKAKPGLKPMILVAASVGILLLAGGAMVVASSFRPMAIFAKSDRPALPADTPAAIEGKGAKAAPTAAPMRSTAALLPALEGSSSASPPPPVSASNPGSMGITVQTSSNALTLEQLAEVQRRQQIAAMSQRMAKMQAEETAKAATSFPAVLTSAVVDAPSSTDPSPTPSAAPATTTPSAPALAMPSAMIGPLSLRLAAAKGDASAQFEVAARFAEGRGVKQDFAQALIWYQRSAALSFAPAQYRLATLYERGLGTSADQARALVWYKRAAEGGYVKAMHNLAALSSNRAGAAPDYATATQWFTRAAEHGLADSQYNLGVLAESGLGMERDVVIAYKWLSLAANQGDKDAARRRDALKVQLSQPQLRAAEQQVGAWKSEPIDQQINDDRRAGEAWKTRA